MNTPESKKVIFIRKHDIPEGYASLKHRIAACWWPACAEEALKADPYAKRFVATQKEEIWLHVSRGRSFLVSKRWQEDWSESVVVEFNVPLASNATEALEMPDDVVLVNGRLGYFSLAGSGATCLGENLIVVGDRIIRKLLNDWVEVVRNPRQAKNYHARVRREEEAKEAQARIEQEQQDEEFHRAAIYNAVTRFVEGADNVVRDLAHARARRSLPRGCSLGFRNLSAETLARKYWSMPAAQVIRKHALRGRAHCSMALYNAVGGIEKLKDLEVQPGELELAGLYGSALRRYRRLKPAIDALWKVRKKIYAA